MNLKLEELFINIITKGKKDNTYKFAFAKFLLDSAKNTNNIDNLEINYYDISSAFLKYYWTQECKYKIKQDLS